MPNHTISSELGSMKIKYTIEDDYFAKTVRWHTEASQFITSEVLSSAP